MQPNVPTARSNRKADRALWASPSLCIGIPNGKVVTRQLDGHRLRLSRSQINVGESFEERWWLARGGSHVDVELRYLEVEPSPKCFHNEQTTLPLFRSPIQHS